MGNRYVSTRAGLLVVVLAAASCTVVVGAEDLPEQLREIGLTQVDWTQLDLNRQATSLSESKLGDLLKTASNRKKGDPPLVEAHTGFRWQEGDRKTRYWMPQGIAGLAEGGKKFLVISWYHKPEYDSSTSKNKGVRLSFVDVTSMSDVRYRHVLLVQRAIESSETVYTGIPIHAGGLVIRGAKVYVPDSDADPCKIRSGGPGLRRLGPSP